ncbi:MAG: phosphate signaling complex protein PhoU [Verrucomicrobiales bacterium]
MSPHILSSYEEALDDLRALARSLCDQALANVEAARRGVLGRSDADCARAIADDDLVNQIERKIDARGIDVLTRFQPVAGDLRFVIAVMRVASNIERVADEAKNIGRRGRILLATEVDLSSLEGLFQLAIEEVTEAVRAFFEKDRDLAATLRPKDKSLDAMHRSMIEDLTARIAANHDAAADYLHLLFIARSLERIGDHAKNIAEETAFVCGPA